MYKFVCVFVLSLLAEIHAWDQEQLEVFDVVEEVNRNFYEFMNVSADADNSQIRKAFRNLSLVLHPDKNSAEDAEIQFRQLVAVYEILKDENKRKYYDDVLVNGLPKWHSAVYYYRQYRKMGFTEMCIILLVLVTIGQYLIGWAIYFEKKYTYVSIKTWIKSQLSCPVDKIYNLYITSIPKLYSEVLQI